MEDKFHENVINSIHLLEERVQLLEKKYNQLQHLESDVLDIKRNKEETKK